RIALFAVPVLAHLFWRHAYYGSWVPSTFSAKTGDVRQQFEGGRRYLAGWLEHAGPIVFISTYAVGLGIVRRHRELLTVAALFFGVCGYVLLVGGDWMSYFRFMAPAEPWAFLLCGVAVREIFQTKDRAAWIALVLFSLWLIPLRI